MSVLVKKHQVTYFSDQAALNGKLNKKLVVYEGDTNVVVAFELFDSIGNNLLEQCPKGTTIEAIFCPPEGDKVVCPLNIVNNRIFIEYSVGTMESNVDSCGTLHLVRVNTKDKTEVSREVLPSINLIIKKNPSIDSLSENLLVASDGAYLITSDHDYILI